MKITDIPEPVLANLVRNGCYTKGEAIGPDDHNQFLLVLAVPYGKPEGITTRLEALEAFHELLDCSDWFERSIQVLTIVDGKPHVAELSHEDIEDEDDDESTEPLPRLLVEE